MRKPNSILATLRTAPNARSHHQAGNASSMVYVRESCKIPFGDENSKLILTEAIRRPYFLNRDGEQRGCNQRIRIHPNIPTIKHYIFCVNLN